MALVVGAGRHFKPTRLGLEMLESRQLMATNVLETGLNQVERSGPSNSPGLVESVAWEADNGLFQPLPFGDLNSSSPVRVPREIRDVNGDAEITAIDALLGINYINSRKANSGPLPKSALNLDTTGDGEATAEDILTVINYINARAGIERSEKPVENVTDAKWDANGILTRTIARDDGTVVLQKFENNKLQLLEETIGSHVVRTSWDEPGKAVRRTFESSKFKLEEVWDSAGGFRRTSWPENGETLRESFQNSKHISSETWKGNNLTRVAWNPDNTVLRQTLENGLQVREESWSSGGGYLRIFSQPGGTSVRETFKDGNKVLREESQGDLYTRISFYTPSGTLREEFTQGQLSNREITNGEGVLILKQIEAVRTQITAGQQQLNYDSIPDLLAKLRDLENQLPEANRAPIAAWSDALNQVYDESQSGLSRITAWNEQETARLTGEQQRLATYREKIDKLVQEYQTTWSSVKNSIRNYQIPDSSTPPKNPTRGFTPPTGTNNGRAPVSVFDPMLEKTKKLQEIAGVLHEIGGTFGIEFQSIIDMLNAGIATYIKETSAASQTHSAELTRLDGERYTAVSKIKSDAETKIAPLESDKNKAISLLEASKQRTIDDTNKAIASRERQRDGEIAANEAIIAQVHGGFFLGGLGGQLINEGAKILGGGGAIIGSGIASIDKCIQSPSAFTDCLEKIGGDASQWTKEQKAKATNWANTNIQSAKDWFTAIKETTLAVRDRTIQGINDKIADTKAGYDAVIAPILKKRDEKVAEVDTKYDEKKKDVSTVYNKAKEDAKTELFDVGAKQLGDALQDLDGIKADIVDDLGSVKVTNPLGTIDDLKNESLVQASGILAPAAEVLGDVFEDLGSTASTWADKAQDFSSEQWDKVSNYADDRWQAFSDYSGDRWEAFTDFLSEAWEPVDNIFRQSGDSHALFDKVVIRPLGDGRYKVLTDVIGVDENLRAIRVVVERGGIEVVNNYLGVGGKRTPNEEAITEGWHKDLGSKPYELDFEAIDPSMHKISVALKDFDNSWFQTVGGEVVLPITEDFILYERPKSEGTSGGDHDNIDNSILSDAPFSWAVVTAPTEAEAEAKRGFPLPYVLGSASVYQTRDATGRDRFVLGFDTVQITDETEIDLVVQQVDSQGNSVAPAEKQRALDDYARQEKPLKELAEDYSDFKEWIENASFNPDGLSYEQYIRYWHGEYAKYYRQSESYGESLPSFLDQDEWWFSEPTTGFEYFSTGQRMWSYDWGSAGMLREAANAPIALANLRKQGPDFSRVPQDQRMSVRGSAIAKGLDITQIVNKVIGNGFDYKVSLSVKGGSAAAEMRHVDDVMMGDQLRDVMRGAIGDTITSIGKGLSSFLRKIPVYTEPNWDKASEIVHTALGVAGMVPVIGAFADGADVVLYAIEGDATSALISAVAMVPGLGDGVKAAVIGATKTGVLRVGKEAIEKAGKEVLEKGLTHAKSVAEAVDKVVPELRVIADKMGIFRPAATHYQVVAESYGVTIALRPTTPEARKLLAGGFHLPKPAELKQKTISKLDLDLGAKGEIGEVAMFKPVLPTGASDAIKARYKQRLEEWNSLQDQYKEMTTAFSGSKFRIDTETGVIRMRDGNPGMRFTGDNDTYAILDRNGFPLYQTNKAKYEEVKKALAIGDSRSQHGDHIQWNATEMSDVKIKEMINTKHTSVPAGGSGEETLGVFRPGQKPILEFADFTL